MTPTTEGICYTCGGDGYLCGPDPASEHECPTCHGSGTVDVCERCGLPAAGSRWTELQSGHDEFLCPTCIRRESSRMRRIY